MTDRHRIRPHIDTNRRPYAYARSGPYTYARPTSHRKSRFPAWFMALMVSLAIALCCGGVAVLLYLPFAAPAPAPANTYSTIPAPTP